MLEDKDLKDFADIVIQKQESLDLSNIDFDFEDIAEVNTQSDFLEPISSNFQEFPSPSVKRVKYNEEKPIEVVEMTLANVGKLVECFMNLLLEAKVDFDSEEPLDHERECELIDQMIERTSLQFEIFHTSAEATKEFDEDADLLIELNSDWAKQTIRTFRQLPNFDPVKFLNFWKPKILAFAKGGFDETVSNETKLNIADGIVEFAAFKHFPVKTIGTSSNPANIEASIRQKLGKYAHCFFHC